LRWTDIDYTHIDLDVGDVDMGLITVEDAECYTDAWGNVVCYDKYLLELGMPLISHWEISANQEIEGDCPLLNFGNMKDWEEIFDDKSSINVVLNDMDFNFITDLKLDSLGYIDADLWSCEFNFGDL
jgi:hypothetical protein